MQYNKVEFLGDTFDPALPPKKPWLAMKTRLAFNPPMQESMGGPAMKTSFAPSPPRQEQMAGPAMKTRFAFHSALPCKKTWLVQP